MVERSTVELAGIEWSLVRFRVSGDIGSVFIRSARYLCFAFATLTCQIRDSIVVSISACHADDPGSIPGRGGFSPRTNDWRQMPQLTGTFTRLFRLAVRTSRCGRDNPGSNPGRDTLFFRPRTQQAETLKTQYTASVLRCPSSSVGRAQDS